MPFMIMERGGRQVIMEPSVNGDAGSVNTTINNPLTAWRGGGAEAGAGPCLRFAVSAHGSTRISFPLLRAYKHFHRPARSAAGAHGLRGGRGSSAHPRFSPSAWSGTRSASGLG